jgi:hypothetical protein
MASQEPIYRYLTDDGLVGDGTNHLSNVNGSVTSVPFYVGPSSNMWAVHRMIVMIEDNATFTADNYGGVSTLTNGVKMEIREGDAKTGKLVTDLMDGEKVHSLVQWADHCYDMTEHTFGSGNNFAVVRWTFSNAGRPLVLDSRLNEKLVMLIDDDLSALVAHEAIIQGHEIFTPGEQLNTWGA